MSYKVARVVAIIILLAGLLFCTLVYDKGPGCPQTTEDY